MKQSAPFWFSLIAVALGAAALALHFTDRQSAKTPASHAEHGEAGHYEVAPAMGDMQRFIEKLFHAGTAGNWELAGFYLHEIEETTEEIAGAQVIDEGVPVSDLIKTMLPPSIENLEKAIQSRSPAEFAAGYKNLVQTCNACHMAAKHEFIKIIVPAQQSFHNQDFNP